MAARRSPLAVLMHVLAVLATCAIGRIMPTPAAHAPASPAVTATRGAPSATAALRADRAVAEVRIARGGRSGASGVGPDVVAVPPASAVGIAPPEFTRLAAPRSAQRHAVFIAPPPPSARGPPGSA